MAKGALKDWALWTVLVLLPQIGFGAVALFLAVIAIQKTGSWVYGLVILIWVIVVGAVLEVFLTNPKPPLPPFGGSRPSG